MMNKRLVLSALCLFLLTPVLGHAAVNTSAEEQLSDAMIRSAVTFMGYSQVIETDEPFVLAASLLDAAIELNPNNAQAWSMRAELAETAGEKDAYEKALVGYLDTGIKDDRARFNLIRFRLAQNNTLDAQLLALERLLNSDTGRALAGPLRSKLASFASSIASELLDQSARRKWAVEAARADPANLEAAQAMLELVNELGGDPVRRGTATVNVIRADPLSTAPRLELAALLAEHAAFERAAQQYQVVSTRLSSQPLSLSAYTNWAQCLAMSGRDELLIQLLDEFEKALNQAPAQQAGVDEQVGDGEESNPPRQEPVDLPIRLELIRLAVLDNEGNKDQAQIVFDRIARRLKAQPDDAEPQASKQNLAAIAAVFGPNLDQAQAIAKATDNDPVALGWIALRRGDHAEAQKLLGPVAAEQPLAACGMAIATGQDDAGRARLLQSFIQSSSTSSLAALAAGRAMLAMQTPAQPTTTGKAMIALMARHPQTFWLVDIERTPWLEVRMKIAPQRIRPLQPITAEITVWNTTRFPLAIREDGPIRPKAIVNLTASNSGRLLPPSPPIVVDIGRALTLKAGERLIFDTRLDYHQFGALRATNPGAPFAFDARLMVNPIVTPHGTWRPSGVGGLSDVRNCIVQTKTANEQDIDNWLANLNSDESARRLEAMMRLAALNRDSQPDLVGPALLQRVGKPMLDTWDSANAVEQAWILLNTIGLGQPNASYPELLDRAIESKSKLVWLALLASQATEADSPILRTAIGRQDLPEISRFAERQRRLLRTYADYLEKRQQEQSEGAGE